MNTKITFALIGIFALGITVSAQSNLLNAKTPDEIGKKSSAQLKSDNDKPLPYGYVDDRDVLMGKMVWEIIDLDERINFPLYFPIDTNSIGNDRRSLFDVLLKGIKSGKITQTFADGDFNTKRTLKDMSNSFKFVDTTDAGKDEINNNYDAYYPKPVGAKTIKGKKLKGGKRAPDTVIAGNTPDAKVLDLQYVNARELGSQDITNYKIKGYWYFDNRQGEMKYRLLGLCPMTPEAKDIGKENADLIELFWIYFPDAREELHKNYAFNPKNSAQPISYDNLLNSRRFNAVIYQEDNVYGNRKIEDYLKDNAQSELLESERIKEKIRNFEQDMWNY
jgi:gliding motility associated protien GldN